MNSNMKKVQLLKYAICILVVMIMSSVGVAYASDLTDIDTHWSKEYVEYLVDKGSINGYPDQTFRPDNTVTYAEAIKMIVASYNKNIGNGEPHWASNYVEYARNKGIIPENMFYDDEIDESISRKEVIYMIYQSLLLDAKKPITNNNRIELDLPFRDVNVYINDYGIDYIKPITECYYLGIIIGDDIGLMNPDALITRGEISTILTRAYEEEYRSYPTRDVTGFYPQNNNEYGRILAYMSNDFYEEGYGTWAKYSKGGTPIEYLIPYIYDEPNKAFDSVRSNSEKIMNAVLNVSYEMTEQEWNRWKEKILVASDVTKEQVEEYIQYVKNNMITIKGGALMNPCTLGRFYISKNDEELGIKGMTNYEIVSNPNKLGKLTIAEYITNKKGIINVKEPKFVIMYLKQQEVEYPETTLYNLEYFISTIIYR